MIDAKYTGCGKKPNGTSRFCLSACDGVHLARAAGHRRALGRPRDREDVEHVTRLALADRLRREVRRGRGPCHASTPRRCPHLVRGAEVLVERVDVEVGERARPRDAVDVGRGQARVGDRPFRGLGADLTCGPPRRLRVRRLADARDRDLPAHVVELVRVAPSRPARWRNVSADRQARARGGRRAPHRAASRRRGAPSRRAARPERRRRGPRARRCGSRSPRAAPARAPRRARRRRGRAIGASTPASRVASSPTSAAYALLHATWRSSRSRTRDHRLRRSVGIDQERVEAVRRRGDGAANAATMRRRSSQAPAQLLARSSARVDAGRDRLDELDVGRTVRATGEIARHEQRARASPIGAHIAL